MPLGTLHFLNNKVKNNRTLLKRDKINSHAKIISVETVHFYKVTLLNNFFFFSILKICIFIETI